MPQIRRNDPCPCGSGKKYKQCCLGKDRPKTGPRKFKAKVIHSGTGIEQPKDLMERTFGDAIKSAEDDEKPPVPKNDEE